VLIENDNTPIPTRKEAPMEEKTDVYEKITAEIIDAIEAGCSKLDCRGTRSAFYPQMRVITAVTEE
jgi:hypothetical protein